MSLVHESDYGGSLLADNKNLNNQASQEGLKDNMIEEQKKTEERVLTQDTENFPQGLGAQISGSEKTSGGLRPDAKNFVLPDSNNYENTNEFFDFQEQEQPLEEDGTLEGNEEEEDEIYSFDYNDPPGEEDYYHGGYWYYTGNKTVYVRRNLGFFNEYSKECK